MAGTCGYMQCRKPAQFYGPTITGLEADETYPTYTCEDHTDGLAIVRMVPYPVTDQPPGYPIYQWEGPSV